MRKKEKRLDLMLVHSDPLGADWVYQYRHAPQPTPFGQF